MKALFICAFLMVSMMVALQAQWPVAVGTRYSDSFSEWVFYDLDEQPVGYIRPRWALSPDRMEWDYCVLEFCGTIRRKWANDPGLWELNGDNELYTARISWPDNFRSWDISGEGVNLTLASKYTNILEEWTSTRSNIGSFHMYTFIEGDPRDWSVEESLREDESVHLYVFLMFMVISHSTPMR